MDAIEVQLSARQPCNTEEPCKKGCIDCADYEKIFFPEPGACYCTKCHKKWDAKNPHPEVLQNTLSEDKSLDAIKVQSFARQPSNTAEPCNKECQNCVDYGSPTPGACYCIYCHKKWDVKQSHSTELQSKLSADETKNAIEVQPFIKQPSNTAEPCMKGCDLCAKYIYEACYCYKCHKKWDVEQSHRPTLSQNSLSDEATTEAIEVQLSTTTPEPYMKECSKECADNKEISSLLKEEDPPDELICPITREIMTDPVITAAGQTYERAAIERWLVAHDTDPMAHIQINKIVIPNIAVKQSIQRFLTKKT